MNRRQRLNRWDAVWASGVVAVFLTLGIASGTSYIGLFRVLLGAVILLMAIRDWRANRHGWLPTLAWAVPIGVPWLASLWWFEGRTLFLAFVIGGAAVLIMMSMRAAAWWYEIVLRRPFKS